MISVLYSKEPNSPQKAGKNIFGLKYAKISSFLNVITNCSATTNKFYMTILLTIVSKIVM